MKDGEHRRLPASGDVWFRACFMIQAKATPPRTVIGGITKMKCRMPL